MKDRRNVRAILYDDSKKRVEFLLLYTRKGYWQFPQGGIHPGETEVEAVQREVFEETSLRIWKRDVVVRSKVEDFYYAERGGDPIKVYLNVYAAKVDSDKEVIIGRSGDAHQDFIWVNYSRALSLLNEYPEQKIVFNKVIELMKSLDEGFSNKL